MSKLRHGIEIIGGGLAGLSLGVALRRAGVEVDLYEAGDYPRHRVCGEFIAGLDAATIRTLGLAPFLEGALRHREVAWHTGDGEILFQRLPAPAIGISRHRLDQRIAAAFVEAGGRLHVGERTTEATEGVPPDGRIIATGRMRGKSPWMGLKAHYRGVGLTRDLELHLGKRAYVGLSLVEDGWVNVCGLFDSRGGPRSATAATGKGDRTGALLQYVRAAGMTDLAARLEAAEVDPQSFCAVAALRFDGRVRPAAGIRLGDAAAMIPPFTGNGMAMAFQSAAVALGPLVAYAEGEESWAATVTEVRRKLSQRFRLRLASAGALHSWLLRPTRRRILAAAGKHHLIPFRPLYALLH